MPPEVTCTWRTGLLCVHSLPSPLPKHLDITGFLCLFHRYDDGPKIISVHDSWQSGQTAEKCFTLTTSISVPWINNNNVRWEEINSYSLFSSAERFLWVTVPQTEDIRRTWRQFAWEPEPWTCGLPGFLSGIIANRIWIRVWFTRLIPQPSQAGNASSFQLGTGQSSSFPEDITSQPGPQPSKLV